MSVIIGIDPGIANVGFGVITKRGTRLEHVRSGCIRTTPRFDITHRVYSIGRKIDVLLEYYQPDLVVVEMFIPFARRGNMSAIDKAYGAIIYVVQARDVELISPRPNHWMRKFMRIGARKKFGKLDIQERIDRKLGIRTKVEHEAEALAMAVTYA